MTDAGHRVDASLLDESVEDLYEHAPCGYLSTLPDGTIVRANQTFLEWTGYARDALLATRFPALLAVGSQIYHETHYAPLLQMQGQVSEIALEVVCADGRTLPVLVNARQKRGEDGTVLFHRVTVFDATDRRRYERELLLARRRAEQVARDKAALLSMLSHDIRNPLNALLGVVQLLEQSNLDARQRKNVQRVRSSSESLLDLLNRVLDLSRAESSDFALEQRTFDVRALMQDVASTFATQAEARQLTIECLVDERIPPAVLGDPIAIRQILTNLVANAVKFTEAGSVSLSVRPAGFAGDSVTLDFAVADTGVGMPADRLERIFADFTQASYETRMRFGGSGLGLAISQKLLALHGTSMGVVSTPGQGSTFSFSIRFSVAASPV